MVRTAVLGYPRMGPARELKKALEQFWTARSGREALLREAEKIRAAHWKLQKEAGIDFIPSGDFSFYDHMLDTACMLGAVPARYGTLARDGSLETYFAMARGSQKGNVPALEMTKWFDTNYHYIVPEIARDQRFALGWRQALDHAEEARRAGFVTRPVLVGPVTFLSLAKGADSSVGPLSLLEAVLPVYEEVLRQLATLGASWVQMDEPILVTDLSAGQREAVKRAYKRLSGAAGVSLMLTTYFGDLAENLDMVLDLPVAGLHVDLVRGPSQLARTLARPPREKVLSLGLIDGRNIWKADLAAAISAAGQCIEVLDPDKVLIATSCSLLHCPEDLSLETELDPEIRGWLSFAKQKLREVALVARALNGGKAAVAAELEENRRSLESRARSPRTRNPGVRERMATLSPGMMRRSSPFAERRAIQEKSLPLPLFPTTTIGSFPQTKEVRSVRASLKSGAIDTSAYDKFLEEEIARTVHLQEKLGLDVLVHGEFERNDMVEYFGQMLSGFTFTANGWVQSYGSRCVKPPIIYGDVERPEPMTVRWSIYAQSLTSRPVKGMLTGPVTMLCWSFVRNDQPTELTCKQIALAIRDEVKDLEVAGIRVIQIDEPALREGLPLRRSQWKDYLRWAVEAFRLASSGVRDATQVHSHMCYAQFDDILPSIADMDADVLSIETTRSRMELLNSFSTFRYPNQIGPGVYDIHSPRVPPEEEVEELLGKALAVLQPWQLWVNPDCGLKTREWKEVEPSLAALVSAARKLRKRYGATSAAGSGKTAGVKAAG
ncbi:MAG: 5-methyltetrahydropteroyltriglutamate--homocysteine S-methyltransferase [Spirochaetia bacterium]